MPGDASPLPFTGTWLFPPDPLPALPSVIVTATARTVADADGKHATRVQTEYAAGAEPQVTTVRRGRSGPRRPGHLTNGPWRVLDGAMRPGSYEQTTDGLTYQSGATSYQAKFDGHTYPMTGRVTGTTVTLRRINHRTSERHFSYHGQPIGHAHLALSRNGRSLANLYWDKDGIKTNN